MLSDRERKVLRILWNMDNLNSTRLPLMKALTVKTGRKETDIRETMISLHEKGYIARDPKTRAIKVIKGWEDVPHPVANNYWIGKL